MTRDQIASVWSMPDIETDKSSSSPPKPAKNNSNKAAKNGKANSDKKASPEKKPATIEEAVKKVSVNELKTLLEKVRDRYPENPILWIRDEALLSWRLWQYDCRREPRMHLSSNRTYHHPNQPRLRSIDAIKAHHLQSHFRNKIEL